MKNKLYLSLAFIFSISFANAIQECREVILDNTPNIRYTVHDDGTVTDDSTKLMWKVCSEGQTWDNTNNIASCEGKEAKPNWQEALQIPETFNAGNGYAGYTDWRLPNINELVSIINFKCVLPALNEVIFPNTLTSIGGINLGLFYSSSHHINYPGSGHVWTVDFRHGGIYPESKDPNPSYLSSVRLVRND